MSQNEEENVWSPCDDCDQCIGCQFASSSINDSLNYYDEE